MLVGTQKKKYIQRKRCNPTVAMKHLPLLKLMKSEVLKLTGKKKKKKTRRDARKNQLYDEKYMEKLK